MNFGRTALIVIFALIAMTSQWQVLAHDARPVAIEINQAADLSLALRIRAPNSLDRRFAPTPRLPQFCNRIGAAVPVESIGATVIHYKFQCDASLSGQLIAIDYPVMNPSLSSVFKLTLAAGDPITHLAPPGVTQWRAPAEVSSSSVAASFTRLGVRHIWLGFDHLMFIICVLLIARTGWKIISAITGFTLAHSLTLALSALGVIQLSVAAIEAVIALSIVYVAAEIIRNDQTTLAWRYPVLIASGFGLLHGLGFASVLSEIGLPQNHQLPALLFFNIGVEIGQIAFISLLIFAKIFVYDVFITPRLSNIKAPIGAAVAYAIGGICAFWFFERSLSVFA